MHENSMRERLSHKTHPQRKFSRPFLPVARACITHEVKEREKETSLELCSHMWTCQKAGSLWPDDGSEAK